jgi:hypothetical protein
MGIVKLDAVTNAQDELARARKKRTPYSKYP